MRAAVTLLAAVLLGCSAVPVPRASPYHDSDADVSVTRIVHGSVLLSMRGVRVLIDPWFYSGFVTRQREPLGITPSALPTLAGVLLTGDRGDRFDEAALRTLAATVPRATVPAHLGDRMRALGFREVTSLAAGDRTTIGDVAVTAVPTSHTRGALGYLLVRDGVSVYAAGDTGYFDGLATIAETMPRLDVVLLPIGGFRFFGLQQEMDPEDAARAAAVLDPQRVIPLGYGATGGLPFLWWWSGNPVPQFLADCRERGIERNRIVVLQPGESWHYYR